MVFSLVLYMLRLVVSHGILVVHVPLRNDKTLDWSKLNALADDKIKVLKMMIPDFDRVENIVGKGENVDFLKRFQRALFLQCFQS